MKKQIFILFLLISTVSRAQFYYNDVLGVRETNAQMKSYVANGVKTVSATGITPEGSKATDYTEFREIRENGRALRITVIRQLEKTLTYSRFDEKGRISQMTDSSSDVVNTTNYQYDANDRLVKVETLVDDPGGDFKETETHLWQYNSQGQPEKMWKIRSRKGVLEGIDSLEIRFVPDEKGNPGEEHSYKKGVETEMLYYYFDEKGRVTDIVRYNTKVKKLVPDMILTYDDNDHVIQKITSTSGNYNGKVTWIGYNIWRFIYNDKGLKTKEALFDNNQEIQGKIEYSYSF